jgi:hypothetical protein
VFLFASLAIAVAACQSRPSLVPQASLHRANSVRDDAWGTLVDDPSGKPLAGVAVKLYPWKPCVKTSATTRRCPASQFATTTKSDGRFDVAGMPKGHYLLVIGDDEPSDLVHPTIHDQVWLTGGVQHLLAPGPCATTAPYTPDERCIPLQPAQSQRPGFHIPVPLVERNGDYRILTTNKWQRLCTSAWNAERARFRLPPGISDEWLEENARAMNAYRDLVNPRTRHVYDTQNVTAFSWGFSLGGESCRELVLGTYGTRANNPPAYAPQTLWFGGTWTPYIDKKSPNGFVEYPLEVRLWPAGQKFFSRGFPPWP